MASNKQRGLGRDLQALLGNRRFSNSTSTESVEVNTPLSDGQLTHLPIESLRSGRYQPRKVFEPETLKDLANSIRSQGILQPLVVRKINDRDYEIVAGERRWRAAQLAELEQIPVIVKEIDDETAGAVALIENVQREDLNPIEIAVAYHRLVDEFGITHQDLANLVGKSRTAVTNILRLLNLNSDVRLFLENGDLEMGHARALLGLNGDQQSEAARTVVGKSYSVRETEHLVRRLVKGMQPQQNKTTMDPDTFQLQQRLSETLGTTVSIQHNASGKGKLVINYANLDVLDGILAHIQ